VRIVLKQLNLPISESGIVDIKNLGNAKLPTNDQLDEASEERRIDGFGEGAKSPDLSYPSYDSYNLEIYRNNNSDEWNFKDVVRLAHQPPYSLPTYSYFTYTVPHSSSFSSFSQINSDLRNLFYKGFSRDVLPEIKSFFDALLYYRENFRRLYKKEINENEYDMILVKNRSRVLDIEKWETYRIQIKELFERAYNAGHKKGNLYIVRGVYDGCFDSLDSFFKHYDKIAMKIWDRIRKRKKSKAFLVRSPHLEPIPLYLAVVFEFTYEEPLSTDEYPLGVSTEPFCLEGLAYIVPDQLELFMRLISGWYLDLDWDTVCVFWHTSWRCVLVLNLEVGDDDEEEIEKQGYEFVREFDKEELAEYLEEIYGIEKEIGRKCFDLGRFTLVLKWEGGKRAHYIREFMKQRELPKELPCCVVVI